MKHKAPASLCLLISGSFKIPACLDAPVKQNGKYPVVIFSHGLGAFRYLHAPSRRSFPLCTVDNHGYFCVCVSQDFIFNYMHRIGFPGLYCGICRAQVSPTPHLPQARSKVTSLLCFETASFDISAPCGVTRHYTDLNKRYQNRLGGLSETS